MDKLSFRMKFLYWKANRPAGGFTMKRLLIMMCLATFVHAAIRSPLDVYPPTDPHTVVSTPSSSSSLVSVRDLFSPIFVGGATWSPDGKQILLSSDISGRVSLWKMAADGGWPVQLVHSDESQFGGTWSPDGQWVVYQQDKGGNELYDLFAVRSDGGESINLTHSDQVSETNPVWSPNGEMLAICYKLKDSPITDIALLDWKTRIIRRLTHEDDNNHFWSPVAWSPDGKTIYANRGEQGYTNFDVYAINVPTGSAENLTAHTGQIINVATSVSADGKYLLLTSSSKGGFDNVAVFDITAKKLTWITNTEWEATSGDFSSDGKWLTYTLNKDGRSEVYLVNRANLSTHKLPLPDGMNRSGSADPRLGSFLPAFSPHGNVLLAMHESSTQPSDYWTYDLQTSQLKQLTSSNFTAANSPPSQIIHYRSFDGTMISALLWIPSNLARDGSNPAIVLPHGGPMDQETDSWDPRVAALSSRYICIAPNVRGSTGYGTAFEKANYQDLGGGDLQDELYAVHFLENTGFVNAKKVSIVGSSYGGFMTLMAIGKTPDTWAAAVDLYGPLDFYTMVLHAGSFTSQAVRMLLGDPEKDRKAYIESSPIRYIRNARAPLLVLQGENDIRIPKEETEQVVDILRQENKIVEVHYYPNEGHGFRRREDRIDSIQRIVQWCDRYLKNITE